MPELTKKEAALKYPDLGFPVLPLKEGGKSPITQHGVNDAVLDRLQIGKWWDENPNYNIGLAMGCGYIALDFDEDDDKDKHGLETLRNWENEHGVQLPATWVHLTPRGGTHYIYRDPYGYKSNPGLYHDVELRAAGYYIVAPPSKRSDGKFYEWECGCSPDEIPVATIDDTVREFLKGEPKETKQTGGFVLPEKIHAGQQEIVFMKLFGKLWSMGLSEESIRSVISIENKSRFEPSWTDEELEKVIFPALNREWDISNPYWRLSKGDVDCWKLWKRVTLLEKENKLLTEKLQISSQN